MKKMFVLLLLPLLLMGAAFPKEKPPVNLGQLSFISASTTDMAATMDFWKKLGFRVVAEGNSPSPWVQFTDETILVHIIQSDQPFTRLTYLSNDLEGTLKGLKKAKVKSITVTQNDAGKPFQAVFTSPDGQAISILGSDPAGQFQPTGKTMLTLDPKDMMSGDKMPTKLGMFGEYCHKVANLKDAMAFWEKLGFKTKGINLMPYPWTIMTDGKSIVGLHQTKDWEGAAITYFAPDMGKRLEALKADGIVGKEIGMGPNNVSVTTPEGLKLFLFSLF